MKKPIESYSAEDFKKHFDKKPKATIKKESEHKIQSDFIKLFRLLYPELLAFSIPNGGHRHILTAVKLKKEGQLSGIPDMFIPIANFIHNGLFIEFKAKGGKLSENQKTVINKLDSLGYYTVICYNCDDALKQVKQYINNLIK